MQFMFELNFKGSGLDLKVSYQAPLGEEDFRYPTSPIEMALLELKPSEFNRGVYSTQVSSSFFGFAAIVTLAYLTRR